jgi:hypothetical protein
MNAQQPRLSNKQCSRLVTIIGPPQSLTRDCTGQNHLNVVSITGITAFALRRTMLVRSLLIVSENASTLTYETYQSYLRVRDHTRQIMFL